ncbi:hypothetical protein JN00_0132 [Metamycoplasma subdolum]|uniref:Uncharacterized protein n=1 Tax=Metamycoplasma subdolum TaxID=92407 RepID=A0A3M0A274_9BACT|nr:hypothetical protein [Metamycoplasma subdolum]RMA79083.1 hypothetical protein JN00_0132 [Metamycoplasma subdolum]WPB50606.1 hypothetical protein R9C05_00380 [Metamycoplasma subdolum]
MNLHFSTLENFKVLIALNSDKELRSKVKTKTLFVFNILSILIFTSLFLCDIILYNKHIEFFDSYDKEYNVTQSIFLGIKLSIFILLYLFNRFITNLVLTKELNKLKDEEIIYKSSEGHYLIYSFLNNKKVNKITLTHHIFDTILILSYLAFSVAPFFKYASFEYGKRIWVFSIIMLLKYIVFDFIWSFVLYAKYFKDDNTSDINHEIGSLANYLVFAITLSIGALIWTTMQYFVVVLGADFLVEFYGLLSIAPLFVICYFIKLVTLFIVFRNVKSKIKYYYIFMLFAIYPMQKNNLN